MLEDYFFDAPGIERAEVDTTPWCGRFVRLNDANCHVTGVLECVQTRSIPFPIFSFVSGVSDAGFYGTASRSQRDYYEARTILMDPQSRADSPLYGQISLSTTTMRWMV